MVRLSAIDTRANIEALWPDLKAAMADWREEPKENLRRQLRRIWEALNVERVNFEQYKQAVEIDGARMETRMATQQISYETMEKAVK
jgi:hypothetical protein